MKGRESGMPQKKMWEGFFKPKKILKTLGLNEEINDVAEFGCGYGTFTIPAAKAVKGTVYAIDIEKEMTALTERKAQRHNLRNIKTILRDFVADGTGLKDESVDYVMLFNILHIEHPEMLLKESCRILREAGKLGMIHWNYDSETPRGPSMAIRPKPEQCIAWAGAFGFTESEQHDLKPYHYGIVMRK
ncbi:MAG: class I SAM-dependent methyltransferase [Candidatus Omnitrophica bacterium]|nr:class I SAM-dependent methyltransferase [Candidatus Omnitrophota bacterium]MBI3009795.1 class I SAM-dependent methyltransferase [Candidatus Omnitrophota bacterium]